MVLLLHFNTYGQIDQRKLDSLSSLIDSSAQAYGLQQDSIIKQQDSSYKSEVNRVLQHNSSKLNNFLVEQKKREAKKRQQAKLGAVIGIALLITVTIVWLRRKKFKF
jgi:hypothetical protein